MKAPLNNRIAVFGPSHAANHFTIATNSTTGQGSQPSASDVGPVNWANFLSGGRAFLEAADCFGYNGDWTDAMTFNGNSYPGMLSRVDAVIASGVGHIVMVGATANDRNSWTAAQSIQNLTTMINKITAAGIPLTIMLDYPHGSVVFPNSRLQNTSANPQLDYWQIVNRYLWSLHGQQGVQIVDTPAIIADFVATNGQALPSELLDGLHLTQVGAYSVGRVLARLWEDLYLPRTVLPFASSERANQAGVNTTPVASNNSYMSGTGGTLTTGAAGQVADNWTMTLSSGISAAYSKVTTTSFDGRSYASANAGPLSKDWQQIILSGTGTDTAEALILRQSVGCTAGDVMRAVGEIEVDAGVTGIAGPELYVWQSAGGTQARSLGIPTVVATSAVPWPNVPIAGTFATPKWGNENTSFNLCLAVRAIVNAPINATIRIRGFAAGKGLAV